MAAISLFDDDIRSDVTDKLLLIPYINISLTHRHVGVRYAACQCVRALSRAVSVLRTNIVDSGLGLAVYQLFRKPDEDPRVMLAAVMGPHMNGSLARHSQRVHESFVYCCILSCSRNCRLVKVPNSSVEANQMTGAGPQQTALHLRTSTSLYVMIIHYDAHHSDNERIAGIDGQRRCGQGGQQVCYRCSAYVCVLALTSHCSQPIRRRQLPHW